MVTAQYEPLVSFAVAKEYCSICGWNRPCSPVAAFASSTLRNTLTLVKEELNTDFNHCSWPGPSSTCQLEDARVSSCLKCRSSSSSTRPTCAFRGCTSACGRC